MTNLVLIKHLIGSNADLSDERLIVAAELVGIDASQEFEDSNRCAIYGLAISEILTDRSVNKITEGGYSVEFNNSGLAGALLDLAIKSKCPELLAQYDTTPKIRNASNRW